MMMIMKTKTEIMLFVKIVKPVCNVQCPNTSLQLAIVGILISLKVIKRRQRVQSEEL